MADKSTIEWTDATWNPTVGCSIVSPGCTNCYAMKVANGLERRFASPKYSGLTKVVNGNPVWTGEIRLDEDALLQPLKWKKPRRIFVNSMSDLFHESLSDEAIDRVFAVMALCPQHTFQVLTKRAKRMQHYLAGLNDLCARDDRIGAMIRRVSNDDDVCLKIRWPLSNVWLGVSVERQQEADERIPHLLQTPAAVRFISAEPLLGPIDLTRIELPSHVPFDALRGRVLPLADAQPGEASLHWIIVGGESGPNARPMHPDWARSLRDQCAAAGVPLFFKQWGNWKQTDSWDDRAAHIVLNDGRHIQSGEVADLKAVKMRRVGKKAAGRLIDGQEHNAFPRPS